MERFRQVSRTYTEQEKRYKCTEEEQKKVTAALLVSDE